VAYKTAQKVYGVEEGSQLSKDLARYFENLRSTGFDPSSVRVEIDPGFWAYPRFVGRTLWPKGVTPKLGAWLATLLSMGAYPLNRGTHPYGILKQQGPHFDPELRHILTTMGYGSRRSQPVLYHEIGHHIARSLGEEGKSTASSKILRTIPDELEANFVVLKTLQNAARKQKVQGALQTALATYLSNLEGFIDTKSIARSLGEKKKTFARYQAGLKSKRPAADDILNIVFPPGGKIEQKDLVDLLRASTTFKKWREQLAQRVQKQYADPDKEMTMNSLLRYIRTSPFYDYAGLLLRELQKRQVFKENDH